jgi:superfamily II DNA or RNA helicase
LGLTATPERLDKKKIEEIFGEYESTLTLQEAIEKDIITNIRCYRLLSNIDLSNVRYNGQDYNNADLEKTLIVDSRNHLIVQTLVKYFKPRKGYFKQGIVFCVNINHAIKLAQMLRDAGLNAVAVHGRNNDNNRILDDYKDKKIQFLCTCQLISEGWDSPQTEIIVMARPTLSKVLYLQQIGRGVRKYDGKECLYIIDVVDNYEGKLIPWSFNSLFRLSVYHDFMGIRQKNNDYLEILGLNEQEMAMQEIDIFTFEEKNKDYRSAEQVARELYIGTGTLNKWVRLDKKLASLYLPIGNKAAPYFNDSDIEK